jgi:hypothetical protein
LRVLSGSDADDEAGVTSALATTPDGYFDTVGNDARDALRCMLGERRIPLELCEDQRHVPGLVAKVLAGDGSYAQP